MKKEYKRAWIEINKENLYHNVSQLKNILPKTCDIMAVIKANAYGHGDIKIANLLNNVGIDNFAVATIDEAINLRKANIKGQILILGYTPSSRIEDLFSFDLSQTIVDFDHAKELNCLNKTIKVHIKIDTGMHRLGEDYKNTSNIIEILNYNNLRIEGIFTHLSSSDEALEDSIAFTKKQISNFYELLDKLKENNCSIPKTHIQSSYGVLNYPELNCDYARIGLALYGLFSSTNEEIKSEINLRPVLSLKTQIIHIQKVKKGEYIGYGREEIAKRDMTIASLPIGYADGINRLLSFGKGKVLIKGEVTYILGKICMDQMLIDITNIKNAIKGDIVTIIGSDGNNKITIEEVSENLDTIPNEVLTRFGQRIIR